MFSLFRKKHPYLQLNLGLVKENYAIVSKSEQKLWEERGFIPIKEYPVFRYTPNKEEIILLGCPVTIDAFGMENLKNCTIQDISAMCGTYGMGGPGFFGMKVSGPFGVRWITYCIWAASEHLLLNDRSPVCSSAESREIDFPLLKNALVGSSVSEIRLTDAEISFSLRSPDGSCQTLSSHCLPERISKQTSAKPRQKSIADIPMSRYWLITYDGTHLKV